MSLLRTPCYERTFSRIPEIARKELEQKSLHNERKNYGLFIENHQLQSLCFDLERKVRILKADKAILQERNLRVEQQRRKTSEELSSTQDLLRNALRYEEYFTIDQVIFCFPSNYIIEYMFILMPWSLFWHRIPSQFGFFVRHAYTVDSTTYSLPFL